MSVCVHLPFWEVMCLFTTGKHLPWVKWRNGESLHLIQGISSQVVLYRHRYYIKVSVADLD